MLTVSLGHTPCPVHELAVEGGNLCHQSNLLVRGMGGGGRREALDISEPFTHGLSGTNRAISTPEELAAHRLS